MKKSFQYARRPQERPSHSHLPTAATDDLVQAVVLGFLIIGFALLAGLFNDAFHGVAMMLYRAIANS